MVCFGEWRLTSGTLADVMGVVGRILRMAWMARCVVFVNLRHLQYGGRCVSCSLSDSVRKHAMPCTAKKLWRSMSAWSMSFVALRMIHTALKRSRRSMYMSLREYVIYVMQPCLFIDVRPPSLHIILLLLVLYSPFLSFTSSLPSPLMNTVEPVLDRMCSLPLIKLPPIRDSFSLHMSARDRRCWLRDHRRLTQPFAATRGLGFSM